VSFSSLPANDGIGLPVPYFKILASAGSSTVTSHGGNLTTLQAIQLRTLEVPDVLLTDPALDARIELMRFRVQRGKRIGYPASRRTGLGWVHPTSYVSFNTPPHQHGTRHGSHAHIWNSVNGEEDAGDRQTEWPVYGLTQNDAITFGLTDIFARWFRVANINETGGSNSGLFWLYSNGVSLNRGNRPSPLLEVPRGITNIGKFAFRYSYYSAADGHRVTGAMSEPFEVRIARPLFKRNLTNPMRLTLNPQANLSNGDSRASLIEARYLSGGR